MDPENAQHFSLNLALAVDKVYQLHILAGKYLMLFKFNVTGAQWLSGRVLDSRLKSHGFEPHRRHCVVSLSKTHLS